MPARTAGRIFIRYGRISTFPGWFGIAARTRLRATPGKPETACCAILLTRRQPEMPEHPQRPRDPYGQTRPRQADRRSTQTRRGRSAVEHDNPPYRSAAGALDAGEQIRLPRPSQAAARQHVRAAHDEFGRSRAAVAATPFHLHQRHVTVAGSDQCGKLGVLGAVACLAPDVHPVARAGDRARRRQVVRHGRNGAGRGSTAETPASGA